MVRVLVPLAPGFEELECVAVVDYLRRAGAQVILASLLGTNPILGRNKMRMMADIDFHEALEEWGDGFDALVVPGGPSVSSLVEEKSLLDFTYRMMVKGKLVGAICAAPRVLAAAGLDPKTKLTSHPDVRESLSRYPNYSTERVVKDGQIITSRGAGTSIEFALALVKALFGEEREKEIKESTVS